MLSFFRSRRRAQWRAKPFPEPWEKVLARHVPYYSLLPPEHQATLKGHIHVFFAEKNIEGCNGLHLTDRMRLTIAAHACVLLLGHDFGFFPGLESILLYPGAFIPRHKEEHPSGIVDEDPEAQEGESWDRGVVILSWEDIRRDLKAFDGRNVLFHEFAHQLYDLGEEAFPNVSAHQHFIEVFAKHYERHVKDVNRRRPTFFDEYGAEDPAEFFAVATEAFFEQPLFFRQKYPAFYKEFQAYYRQNPAEYFRQ
ncbi:MAG TPA: zinc-dependent peptidase [Candidatus Hydrogenedentes bacterium]|nr:zinc-dependent peptidase [Candidatus Hydrogenedentota bacterium]